MRGASFDQFVCTAGQRQWDANAERLGGLEVDHQLEFGGSYDR
jgi:hypothetical protein